MTFRRPDLAGMQQLRQGDPTGGVNCAAYSGRGLADADSQGACLYTGRQVRLNTDEPVPDPQSPGLNWGQIDASLFRLSGGRVNLDVHPGGSSFSTVGPALRAGKWAGLAIWRGVLVDEGYAGSDGFRRGHAVIVGYDPDSKRYILGDPLTPRWLDVPLATLERACRQFLLASGYGSGASGAYFALTRNVSEPPSSLRYSALFSTAGFWVYTLSGGEITGRVAQRFDHATSAPCDAPKVYPWAGHGSKKLVRIRTGTLAGRYVEPGNGGVTLLVKKVRPA